MQKRILLLDDSEDIRIVVSARLRRMGFDVLEENNGHSGLSRIALLQARGIPLHGILLDLEMPFLDGLSVLQELHDRRSNIPVVVMSALEERDYRDKCLALGARDYLAKPFQGEDLQEVCLRAFGIGIVDVPKGSGL